ncbi:hypothetical protein BAC3_00017 [uncultured bacterium]|nr:hypothetical protein BAC3_00017 [uncultured bacterium]
MKTYKKFTSFTFAMFICVCIVLPVFKANNFFMKKEETQDRNISLKNITIPKAIVPKTLKEEPTHINAQAIQNKPKKEKVSQDSASVAEADKPDEIIVHEPVKAVHAQTDKSQQRANPVSADLPHTAPNQRAPRDNVIQENNLIEQKFVEKSSDNSANKAERFNFEKYGKNLVEIAGLEEGEKMPVLELDDFNYKEGLSFYGYQLVARPQPLPKEPYYFAFNNKEIKFAKGKCPYIGTFHPAEQADKLLFERLLSQSAYNELAKDTQFQLFYAPMDAEKERLLRCKIKTILGATQGDVSEVIKIHGKFKRAGDAYILIVESLQNINGEIIPISDRDNNMVAQKG